MRILVLLLTLALNAQTLASDIETRLRALEQKLEDQEFERSMSKRVKFSGTFLTHYEVLNSQLTDDAGVRTNNYGGMVGSHLALNIDINVNSHLDFFTTLGMGKIWNNDGREGETEPTYRSNQGSWGYTGSEAYFDVAYARWKRENWSFALGRMTTQGGPPLNQLDALSRSGTYPRFAYNAIFDGAALVYRFRDLPNPDLSWVIRVFYTPYFFVNTNDRTRPAEDSTGGRVRRRSDQFALLNELELNTVPWAKKLSLYSMLWTYNNFYDQEFQDDNRGGVEYYRALSHTLFLGIEDFMNSGLSISWSHLRVADKLTGSSGSNSDSHLVNINYTRADGDVVGIELIKTDADFYLDDFTYMQFNDFYQRSDNEGIHYFYTFVLDPNQRVRVGVYDYNAAIATQNNWDEKERTQNAYARYRLDF